MKDHQQTIERFEQYLDETLGQHGRLSTPTPARLGALSYHLRDAFDLHAWNVFDRNLIVAEAKAGEKLTPAQLSKHVALLEQALGTRVVVLAMEMAAPNRKRLIEHKVPFVVPGRQMYLPDLMIDLREHFNATKKMKTKLLPSAQLILFYHLLRKPLSAMHLTALARLLDYTPMTAMRAVDNLEGAGLCETEQLGRDRFVVFPLQSKALWEKAKPFLTTPIEKEVFVAEVPAELACCRAGLTALAERSLLADDSIPTFAVDRVKYRSRVRHGRIREEALAELATAKLQLWKYPPAKLATENVVDDLSLYVSCQGAKDERVELALDELKQRIESQWS